MDLRKIAVAVVVVAVIIWIAVLNWDREEEASESKPTAFVGGQVNPESVSIPFEGGVEAPMQERTELENGAVLVVPKGTKAKAKAQMRLELKAKKEEESQKPLPSTTNTDLPAPTPSNPPSPRRNSREREERGTSYQASASKTINNTLIYHNHQNRVIVVQRGSGLSQSPQQRVRFQGRSPGEALDDYFDGAWSNGCQPRRSNRSWGGRSQGSWGSRRGPGEAMDNYFDNGGGWGW